MKYMNQTRFSVFLTLVIVVIWCVVYSRTTLEAWKTPVAYTQDAWQVLGMAKGYGECVVNPFSQKFVSHLNAPFTANWNDTPITEDLLLAAMGWLGNIIGPFASSNFFLLLAQVLAGLSFWWVGSVLKYRQSFVFVGAVVFAFSPYSFCRALGHINLTYYWHVPLFLLVTWWAFSRHHIILWGRKWWMASAISLVTGTFSPYYTFMYLQFLGFAVLLHVVRKQWQQARIAFFLGCIAVAGFLLMNVDTLTYQWTHGSNAQAALRILEHLEKFGLKLPELFAPPGYHRWHWLSHYWQSHYYSQTVITGETGYSYLGFIGIAGLLWLSGLSLFRVLKGLLPLVPMQSLQVLWILLYSLVGGINLLIGVFGFLFIRATNRYSIIILAIALLYLVRQLSRSCPWKLVHRVALGILILGLWDQLPPPKSNADIQQVAQVVHSDFDFVKKLETTLPVGSMVFQLPVVDFPEGPEIHLMTYYEHFRPYLFSRSLHFSYGSDKGRYREAWQKEIEKMPAAQMAAKLEEYGFGAIYINRKGYKDRGDGLIAELAAAGKPILAENTMGDLVAIRLTPSSTPTLPEVPPWFSLGWSEDEGTHRWSISSVATIELWNNRENIRKSSIRLMLGTLKPRRVKITLNSEPVATVQVEPGTETAVGPIELALLPGKNVLRFETDVPPDLPGTNDTRKLSFHISGLNIDQED